MLLLCVPSIWNHPSYNDRYRKVFSLPLKGGGLSILIAEDRANEFGRSVRNCEPLQNQNAIDSEFHQEKILQKIRKEKLERKNWQSRISSIFSRIGYEKRSVMLAKHTSI